MFIVPILSLLITLTQASSLPNPCQEGCFNKEGKEKEKCSYVRYQCLLKWEQDRVTFWNKNGVSQDEKDEALERHRERKAFLEKIIPQMKTQLDLMNKELSGKSALIQKIEQIKTKN